VVPKTGEILSTKIFLRGEIRRNRKEEAHGGDPISGEKRTGSGGEQHFLGGILILTTKSPVEVITTGGHDELS